MEADEGAASGCPTNTAGLDANDDGVAANGCPTRNARSVVEEAIEGDEDAANGGPTRTTGVDVKADPEAASGDPTRVAKAEDVRCVGSGNAAAAICRPANTEEDGEETMP